MTRTLKQLIAIPGAFRQYEYMLKELTYDQLDSPEILEKLQKLCINRVKIEPIEAQINELKAQIPLLRRKEHTLNIKKTYREAKAESLKINEIYKTIKDLNCKLLQLQGETVSSEDIIFNYCMSKARRKLARRIRIKAKPPEC